jgi:hypothetical protein
MVKFGAKLKIGSFHVNIGLPVVLGLDPEILLDLEVCHRKKRGGGEVSARSNRHFCSNYFFIIHHRRRNFGILLIFL